MTQGFDFGAVWASLNLSEAAEVFLRVDNVTDVEYEQPNAFSAPPRVGQIGVRTRF
jgi:outer membrane receptor protein involved in Fe transport